MIHCQKCTVYHRKIQKLESEIIKLKKRLEVTPLNTWASTERQAEAEERERMANVIERHK